MGGRAALDGMARRLLRRGVTSFLPTAVTAPLAALVDFAGSVRDWSPDAPDDGAEPLGFNLEGPFLARARRGAHDPAYLQVPAEVPRRDARAAPRRTPAGDDRTGAAGRHGSHRLARGPWRGDLDRPFARDPRAGAGRLRGGRPLHDPPVQRDDGCRPPCAGRGRRRPARRRGVRRADRGRHPRRSGVVAAHHAPEAGGPAAARQRRRRAGRDGRRPRAPRRPRGRGRGAARDPGGDADAGRVRPGARHGGRERRRVRRAAAGGRRGGESQSARHARDRGPWPDRGRPAGRPRGARPRPCRPPGHARRDVVRGRRRLVPC